MFTRDRDSNPFNSSIGIIGNDRQRLDANDSASKFRTDGGDGVGRSVGQSVCYRAEKVFTEQFDLETFT